MLAVISAVSTSLLRDPAEISLGAPRFQLQSLSFESAIAALRATALGGGRIDAVVLSFSGSQEVGAAIRLAQGIRNIDARLSFRGAVRVSATPIVFFTRRRELVQDHWTDPPVPDSMARVPWSALADSLVAGSVELEEALLELVAAWRQALLRELDYVGYAVSIDANGRARVGHALRRRRRESELLSDESTPGALRSAQYLVLAEDFLETFGTYDKLKFLIENYEGVARSEQIKPETVFQRFFEDNPHLLYRDQFDQHWSQPTLRLPERSSQSYRPDFVLRPRVAANVGANWEVLDLKLPKDGLVSSRGFHPTFSAKLHRAVQQLRDYRDYFSRPDTREALTAKFGYQPLHPRVSVLIGRRDDAEVLASARSHALDVNIITYDDIVEFEESRLALQSHFAGLFNS